MKLSSTIADELIVVKMGGSAMGDATLLHQFASDVVDVINRGARVVVTHGGGPQINARLEAAGITPRFVGGLRYTDEATMAVVRATLTTEVQRRIADAINAFGPWAVGLSGEDAGMFVAQQRTQLIDGTSADLGMVGNIINVDTATINAVLNSAHIPVVTCLAASTSGEVFNVNADTAASALASALKADRLILLTDVAALYADWPANQQPIHELTTLQAQTLMAGLEGGMVPKLQACIDAVAGGVHSAQLIDGRTGHALSAAIDNTNEGTLIRHG